MNLLDYIRGNKKGKDAQRLEKEAMTNPFMYEAMEGFDSVDDDHSARLDDVYKQFASKFGTTQEPIVVKNKRHPLLQALIATAAMVTIVCTFFLIDGNRNTLIAQSKDTGIIDIYVPCEFYSEHMDMIVQTNTAQIKLHRNSVNIPKPTVFKDNHTLAQNDIKNFDRRNTPITIYVPQSKIERSRAYLNPNSSGAIHRPATISRGAMAANSVLGKLPPKPLQGYEAYEKYIKDNIIYPTDNICKRILGRTIVEFSVDDKGRPYQLEIVQSLCDSSDEEAMRLVSNGPKWTPSPHRGTVAIDF